MESLHFAPLVVVAALSTATASAEADVRPDSLLAVDTHRQAIVEKTIAAWPGCVAGEEAEALRRTLWGLRAAIAELLRERSGTITRTRLVP